MVSGKEIVFNFSQLLNTLSSISVRVLGRITSSRLLHSAKAYVPIDVIVLGISTFFILSASLKAKLPMPVTISPLILSGTIISVAEPLYPVIMPLENSNSPPIQPANIDANKNANSSIAKLLYFFILFSFLKHYSKSLIYLL